MRCKRLLGFLILLSIVTGNIYSYDFYEPPFGFENANSFQEAAKLQIENSSLQFFELGVFLMSHDYSLYDFRIEIESGFSDAGMLGSVIYEFTTSNENVDLEDLLLWAVADTIIANDIPEESVTFYKNESSDKPGRHGMINPDSEDFGSIILSTDYDLLADKYKLTIIVTNNAIYRESYNELTRVWEIVRNDG